MTVTPTLERASPIAPPSAPEAASTHVRGSGLGWIFTAFFGVFGWAIGLAKLTDNSFFWHLKTGEYILDHGIPHHDVFSYTAPGAKWVAQSWLAEVTYAVLFRSMGGFGIRLLVGLVGAGIGMLTYRLALRLVRDRLVACGLTAAALAGIYTVWSERPLLLGVLFLLVLLWTVEVHDCFVGRHPMVVVPVLMWLWANSHGTYQLGFAYLGLHLLGRWIDGNPPWVGRERRLLFGALIAFAVVFVNPYGVGLVTFPIELLSRGEILSHIVEWKSPDFRQAWGVALGIWIVVYVVALSRGRHKVTRRDLIVTIPMLLLALWAVRNVAIAPLICLPVVARAFARDEEKPSELRGTMVAAAITVLVFAALVMGYQASTETNFDFSTYPVASMRYLERHDLMGKHLLTTDAAAGYVILEDWPKQKVFIDDRYDMYPTSVIYDYFDLTGAKPGSSKVLDKYDVDVIIWGKDTSLASLLNQSDGWKRVHTDATDAVWVRN
ncbi:MAG TPA: hypothetical protein VGN51_16115 [Acidimicrobiia bacterium]